jgi:DNA-binding NarL/FixJ family response regulator
VLKRILIVDDNPQMRRLMRFFINSQPGFEVCGEGLDGLDAVEKAVALKPDLIILDFRMPRLNGIEAAHVLRESLPYVPIILFTLHKDTISESELANSGIRAVLSKTDGIALLAGQLHRLLPDA